MSTDQQYEVLAVRYASTPATKRQLYYAWDNYGEPDAPGALDYFFYVLRNSDRTVVVDCGFSPQEGARRGRTCHVEPLAALSALGVDAAEVDDLVLTHLHYDHVGNVGAFERARLHVPAGELAFWMGPMGAHPQAAAHAEPAAMAAIAAADAHGRVRPYSGPSRVLPGVEAVAIGGHSPGLHALVVEARIGPVILASDAAHLYEELELERPFGVVVDVFAMVRGYQELKRLAQHPFAVLVAGHDPEVTRRFPLGDDGWLRIA